MKFPYPDDISFRGFAEEALFGFGMPRTHLFDDYTKGSYHVDPREVVERLPDAAALYGRELEAVVVIGPYGPLWAYDVITVVRDKDCSRINWLLMPHARIALKRSACLPSVDVEALFAELADLAVEPDVGPGQDACVVISRAGSVRWSAFDCFSEAGTAGAERLDDWLNRLTPRLQVTYSNEPPGEEP